MNTMLNFFKFFLYFVFVHVHKNVLNISDKNVLNISQQERNNGTKSKGQHVQVIMCHDDDSFPSVFILVFSNMLLFEYNSNFLFVYYNESGQCLLGNFFS